MPSIITLESRLFNAKNFVEAFRETSPDRAYLYVGKTDAWDNELNPDTPIDAVSHKELAFADILAMKQVNSSDMAYVTPRNTWVTGTVYDFYDDLYDQLNDVNPEDTQPFQFYVLTDEFKVYKCLDNSGGAASTFKPTSISNQAFTTVDGYVWKYMYTLESNDVFNFLTSNFMPVRTLISSDSSNQWIVQDTAINGAIHKIAIIDGGDSYSQVSPPAVTITGDGINATASAIVDVSGVVTGIQMDNIGQDYTNATVAIDAGVGTPATARVVISPDGGHGSNPQAELGGHFVMLSTRLEDDEGGKIPTNISFRKAGLIVNPFSQTDGFVYQVSSSNTDYIVGETVEDGGGAIGVVVDYKKETNEIYVNVVSGIPSSVGNLTGENTGANGAINTVTATKLPLVDIVADTTDYEARTGQILYIENREAVARGADQTEEVKITLEF